jgi:hypothetical protein
VLFSAMWANGALWARTMFVTARRRVSKIRTSPEEEAVVLALDDAGAEDDDAVGDGVGAGYAR